MENIRIKLVSPLENLDLQVHIQILSLQFHELLAQLVITSFLHNLLFDFNAMLDIIKIKLVRFRVKNALMVLPLIKLHQLELQFLDLVKLKKVKIKIIDLIILWHLNYKMKIMKWKKRII